MTENKNYFNNYYESFSPLQEAKLSNLGVPKQAIEALDRSLWATLSGDLISKYLTVYEAAELAVIIEGYGELPLIAPLKSKLDEELGIKC